MRIGLDTAQHQLTWTELVERVQFAESAGFDGAWVFDHFTPLYGAANGPCMEGWTLLAGLAAQAEIKITVDHNPNEQATPEFKFKNVPSPTATNAAAKAKFTIVSGEKDSNGGDVEKLNDGKLPTEQDQPEENFFFDAGTEGGRLLMDLGSVIAIKQVNTYSWHPNTRGPQVYKLWVSDGSHPRFNTEPKETVDPTTCGWQFVTIVDTRPRHGEEEGGQYGVSITAASGSLGKYRYLLFDCYVTETADDFGNTFYSEVDVVARKQ